MDPKAFQELVAVAIRIEGYRMVQSLRWEFQVAESTVYRWATGIARPHPRIRQSIAEYIWEQIP